jgi:ABC-2 type transport system permease protein
MRTTLAYLGALLSTNVKASLALRGAFWLQAALMLLNDLLFFCVWWIFFERVSSVRGWTLVDMYALYGFVAFAFGFYAILASGTRDLAQRVMDGELDALLPQPRAVLPRLALSRSSASGWGDIVFGLVLLGLGSQLDPLRWPVLLLLALCSGLVLAMSCVLANSLVFWLGELDGLPRQLFEFTIVFSTYPSALFTGGLRVVLFTLIPAGLVGYLPAEYLRRPSLAGLGLALGATLAYSLFVVWIFGRGLKRYESGNRMSLNA